MSYLLNLLGVRFEIVLFSLIVESLLIEVLIDYKLPLILSKFLVVRRFLFEIDSRLFDFYTFILNPSSSFYSFIESSRELSIFLDGLSLIFEESLS
jgi:hypothetical protein